MTVPTHALRWQGAIVDTGGAPMTRARSRALGGIYQYVEGPLGNIWFPFFNSQGRRFNSRIVGVTIYVRTSVGGTVRHLVVAAGVRPGAQRARARACNHRPGSLADQRLLE